MRSPGFMWLIYPYISFKVASLALELLYKCYSVGALMADDLSKIDKSEPCVNISWYTARDGVSKSVTELTTTRQSVNQSVN